VTVIIRFYGILREIVNERLELHISQSEVSFADLIRIIIKDYPALSDYIVVSKGEVEVKGVTILVNGRHIMFLGGDKALIKDGDVIDMLPPLHGG